MLDDHHHNLSSFINTLGSILKKKHCFLVFQPESETLALARGSEKRADVTNPCS
jgi:hypothetical protein